MIIWINEDTLQLEIRVGATEKYIPTEEMLELDSKVEKIKKLYTDFLDEEYNPKVKSILTIIDRINRKNNPELNKKRK